MPYQHAIAGGGSGTSHECRKYCMWGTSSIHAIPITAMIDLQHDMHVINTVSGVPLVPYMPSLSQRG